MSLKEKLKIRKRRIAPRNHVVVVAKFRSSGPHRKGHKKQIERDLCREKVENDEEEEISCSGTEDAEEEQE